MAQEAGMERSPLIALIATLLFGAIASGSALADERVKTTDGREFLLRSDGTYQILSSDDEAKTGYRAMSITDLKLDIKEIVGEKVEVAGTLSLFGGMATLSDSKQPLDMNAVIASIEELSRADREFIHSQCSGGCRVTVQGEVGMIMLQPGLIIKALVR
jgi:hypothetical protein